MPFPGPYIFPDNDNAPAPAANEAPKTDPRCDVCFGPTPCPDHLVERRLLSDMTSEQRKRFPIVSGFLDYFPDATAYVSHVSWTGNEKHNPGQPVHWARGKSMDHMDCVGRHMIERGGKDENKLWHLGCMAWRAMAELQEFLEKEYHLSLPRGATAPGVELPRQ